MHGGRVVEITAWLGCGMARTRDVAGGGRAIEVEPERLLGWFDRFAARHGGLIAVRGTGR